MSEVHITTTEVIKTKTSITDKEKRIIQTMIIMGNSKKQIEEYLLNRDMILLKSKNVTKVHFVDNGELDKSYEEIREILDLVR